MEDLKWKKSSYCGSAACVQVAMLDDGTRMLRDTKTGNVITLTAEQWDDFIAGAEDGEFD